MNANKMNNLSKTMLAATLLILFSAVQAGELIGRVVGVADGDTLTLLDEGRNQYKIRLAGIDAPEKKQPFGRRSKEKLSDLAFNRNVRVIWEKKDRYGRIVGKIISETRDVNLEMVSAGLAWHYKAYEGEQTLTDRRLYENAEQNARLMKKGLWHDAYPTPPWDFRKQRKLSKELLK